MPKNTRVHRCVDALKKAKEKSGSAFAVCQASTNQSYATGKKLKEAIAAKVLKPGADKAAKKLGDEHDDKWEAEETKKGYWTPAADDTTGYASKTSDNADDDFKHGSWTDETKAKKYGKKIMKKNKQTNEGLTTGGPGTGERVGAWVNRQHTITPEKKAQIKRIHNKVATKKTKSTDGKRPSGAKQKARSKNFINKLGPDARSFMGVENSSRAYKQIGLVLAEAMGHRVDEIAPLVATVARVAGPQILRRGAVALGRNAAPGTAKRGLSVAARKTAKDPEKMKTLGAGLKAGYKKIKDKFTGAGDEGTIPDTPEARKELEDQEKSNEDLGEGKIRNKYVRTLVEKKAWTPPEGMTTSKSSGQEAWRGEGYVSKKSKARGGPGRTAEIPDPKDREAAEKAEERAREKLQLAPEQSTKVSGKVAIELAQRQEAARLEREEAAKKAREDSSTMYSKLGHLFLETTPEAYYRTEKDGPLKGGPKKEGPPKPSVREKPASS